MWLLYQIAFAGGLALAAPFLLIRRGGHYLPTFSGRLGGHRGKATKGGLWIHAVSVGEVGVAATLAGQIDPEVQVLITTVTPTGQARAKALLGKRATIAYLPFDLGFAVRRFYRRFQPSALLLVEGDYWPLLLRAAARLRIPVAVANGRVGERSFRRLRRLGGLNRIFFGPVSRFAVQTHSDLERLLALGVPEERLRVTGNLKYEAPEPEPLRQLEETISRLAKGRPILVAGSTMQGEEGAVLDAYESLGGGSRAFLVLAPRHPERWPAVAELLSTRPFTTAHRSQDGDPAADVLLLDSLGELAALYRLANAAFIGGTLVPTGGHNPLEAARFGVPTAVGPAMDNFRDMADQFDRAGAWQRVDDAAGLAAAWAAWIEDPTLGQEVGRRAVELIERNQGSLQRTLDWVEPVLGSAPKAEETR